MANLGPLAAEIGPVVWGTPANLNGFRVLAALLHGTLVGVSQTLRRSTEGVTYIGQGGHHVGHWPTFLVLYLSLFSEREVTFTFAICYRPFVCRLLSVVCNVRAPYSGCSNFRQYFYGIRYLGYPRTHTENFAEIVPGEPLRRGS